MTDPAELLPLRLDALGQDIETVRAAVKRAQERGQYLEKARESIQPCKRLLRGVETTINALASAMIDEPRIAELLRATSTIQIDDQLRQAPESIEKALAAVTATATHLSRAADTTVSIDDRKMALEKSLKRRCDKLSEDLKKLQRKVQNDPVEQRGAHWIDYETLLIDEARPVFYEYVDFLGGLTVRDTGLDDRVCDMTDALLNRFIGTTPQKSLPLPARQSALGCALDSVVMLGFPEWSIWGIPLVGHEIGLVYANDHNDDQLVRLIGKYTVKDVRSEQYVRELVADTFATYTLGFAYACAALVLRLSPRHDQEPRVDAPTDIERARVIMLTLRAGGDTAPAAGGTYTDGIERLDEIWKGAVGERAGQDKADEAAAQAVGPPAHLDWLDDFAADAVKTFRGLITIRPFDNKRWTAAQLWYDALLIDKTGPGWHPVEDAVPDVLTAAWRLRVLDGTSPEQLAAQVMTRWTTGRKGI